MLATSLSAEAQAYYNRHHKGPESPFAMAWEGAVWTLTKSPELGKLLVDPFRAYDHCARGICPELRLIYTLEEGTRGIHVHAIEQRESGLGMMAHLGAGGMPQIGTE